jgi:hypothetical protein
MTKLVIEIVAGIIPGEPIDKYTKRFTLDDAPDRSERFMERYMEVVGAAMIYQLSLQEPSVVNWVRSEWVWM